MRIDITDLSPQYQRQVAEKILAAGREKQERRRRDSISAVQEKSKNGGGDQRRKFHNQPDERISPAGNIVKFGSRKEARRYVVLMERLGRGEIRNLRLQVDFTLQEGFTDTEGIRTRAIRYKADFTYQERLSDSKWVFVVEDTKGYRTKEYALKKKLMREKLNIVIVET